MAWWAELYEDPKRPMSVRRWASENLMDRALGRPTQAVEETGDAVVKHVFNVRWLPRDPNDRSRYIEPIGGEEEPLPALEPSSE
jgi:hypothetical protein